MMHRSLLALTLAALLAPAAANAAGSFTTWGPQVGFSTGPDQITLGAQLEMGDVAPQIDFVPSVDFGFGDNVTLISLNGDLRYRIPVSHSTWQPYAGAGVSLQFASWDSGVIGRDGSETLGGGCLLFGADVPTSSGNRFFAEGKIGIGDTPDLRVTVGWNFKLR